MTRRIAIDIETSGLDPEAGFGIIRICAVELLVGGRLGANFQSLVKPLRPLIPLAEEVTSITNEMLVKAPSFSDIAAEFLNFSAEAELICLNAAFERAFLNRALADTGLPPLPLGRFMDLSSKVPCDLREQGSDGIYRYAGIKRNPIAPPSHEVALLYRALMG